MCTALGYDALDSSTVSTRWHDLIVAPISVELLRMAAEAQAASSLGTPCYVHLPGFAYAHPRDAKASVGGEIFGYTPAAVIAAIIADSLRFVLIRPLCAAWFLAGLFCILTLPITLYEVALHLEYYSRPALQKHIIRILLMPPIYALDSWFCLRFISARAVLTPIRECYEAYTIYNFFMYLIRYLDGTTLPHLMLM